jgi:hypothetical protein
MAYPGAMGAHYWAWKGSDGAMEAHTGIMEAHSHTGAVDAHPGPRGLTLNPWRLNLTLEPQKGPPWSRACSLWKHGGSPSTHRAPWATSQKSIFQTNDFNTWIRVPGGSVWWK